MQKKQCTTCRQYKDIISFNKDSYDKSGYSKYCKACWKKYKQERYKVKDNKYYTEYAKKPETKYRVYKRNAFKKNREFDISKKDFISLFYLPCHYCGFNKDYRKMGVDRKDNNIGYIKTNIVSSCWDCNKFKGTMNYDSFLKKCKDIAKNHLIY
jgi:hypothetical protein